MNKMESQRQVDYSELEYIGVDKSTYSPLSHHGELVYQFRRSLHKLREFSTLYSRELVSIPESQFHDQMRELEKRIGEIKESLKYKHLINFDEKTELSGLRKQYAEMQRLRKSIDASFKPVR